MKKAFTFLVILLLFSFFSPSYAQCTWWKQKANVGSVQRRRAVGFSIGNKGFIGTGLIGSGVGTAVRTNEFWEYDASANTWTQEANFGGTPRYCAAGFSIGAYGYIGTGYDPNGGYDKDFWRYDTSANIWIPRADFSGSARILAVGFSIDSMGYIGTGYDGNNESDFWQYNPSNDTWTEKADFGGGPRQTAVGFSIGSKGYIGTGTSASTVSAQSGTFYNDFWEYDPTTDKWTQKASFGGTARDGAVGFNIDTLGYIGTGSDTNGVQSDFWEYSPTLDNWTRKGDLTGGARWLATGFGIGAHGYIGTGLSSLPFNDFWEYLPVCISANFSSADTVICPGSCISFTNSSSNNVTAYLWSFPGASITASTDSSPGNICYNNTGKYDVQLIVSNGAISDTLLRKNYITVNAQVQAGTVTANPDTVCSGGATQLIVTLSAGNIQWQSSADGINFSSIPGAVSNTYTADSLSQTLYYRVWVQAGSCGTDSSSAQIIKVLPPSKAGAVTGNPDSVCSGSAAQLTVLAGTGNIQWQSSANGISFTAIPGANFNSYLADSLNQTTYYRVLAQEGNCPIDSSPAQMISVLPQPTAGTIIAPRDTICQGTPANLSLKNNKGTPIQWQSSVNDSNFTNINTNDTTNYKSSPLSQTTWFRAIIGSGICMAASDTLRLFVPPPLISKYNYTASNLTVTFSSDSSSGDIRTYSWNFGDNSSSSNEADPVHTFPKDTTYYVCLTLYDGSNCSYTFCSYLSVISGISPVSAFGSFNIYPNPAGNYLFISNKNTNKQIKGITLYDVLGRVIPGESTIDIHANPVIVNVSGLAEGLYYLKIKTNESEYVQKVVKQ